MPANLPNALTVSRILATPVVCVLAVLGTAFGNWLALAAYLYACITDFLDGYLARSRKQQSPFGEMLDPIADKLLVGALLLVLVGIGRISGIDMLPALIILCREIVVSGLREYLARLNVGMPVTRLAKWKTTLQMVALGFLIVGDAGPRFGPLAATEIGLWGLWLAAVLTLMTGYDYLRASLRHVVGVAASSGPEPAGEAHPVRPLERADG